MKGEMKLPDFVKNFPVKMIFCKGEKEYMYPLSWLEF
jgi:hypothetical protein